MAGICDKVVKCLPLKAMAAELLGTYVLILIGDSAMAITVLGKFETLTLICVAFAWGIGATAAILVSGGISGGHLNPAVTIAMATVNKCPWSSVLPYIFSQFVGGFLSAVTIYTVYYDGINTFDGGVRKIPPDKLATAHIFCTWPQESSTALTCFVDQIAATGLLLVSVCGITDVHNLNVMPFSQPLLIGLVLTAILLAFGFNCMCPLNPARDFGPRLFISMAGWGGQVFSFRGFNYFWVPLIGPPVGAIVGVWIYYWFVEMHHEDCIKHPSCDHRDSILYYAFVKDEATETARDPISLPFGASQSDEA